MLAFYMTIPDTESEMELLEKLYHANRLLMLKIAGEILLPQYAEDAVHNAFLRIAKHIEKFFPLSCNERRYLSVTIVRNISIDMKRALHTDKIVPLEEYDQPDHQAGTDIEILRAEWHSEINRCLGLLTPALRDVIDLRLIFGYDTAETADLLGISEEAVRVRLHRGRSNFRALLEKEGLHHGPTE